MTKTTTTTTITTITTITITTTTITITTTTTATTIYHIEVNIFSSTPLFYFPTLLSPTPMNQLENISPIYLPSWTIIFSYQIYIIFSICVCVCACVRVFLGNRKRKYIFGAIYPSIYYYHYSGSIMLRPLEHHLFSSGVSLADKKRVPNNTDETRSRRVTDNNKLNTRPRNVMLK